jgi:hypothetical protein
MKEKLLILRADIQADLQAIDEIYVGDSALYLNAPWGIM